MLGFYLLWSKLQYRRQLHCVCSEKQSCLEGDKELSCFSSSEDIKSATESINGEFKAADIN